MNHFENEDKNANAIQNDGRFVLNGKEIYSLDELRKNFDLAQVMTAFLDKRLETWLESCYYEREAVAVRELEHISTMHVERQLCQILGVTYEEHCRFSAEQLAAMQRKREILRKYTDEKSILSHAAETATNQTELAQLINAGERTIYLCEGIFSVPISKSGIHYVGVGNLKVETTFTQEQYRRAGITFTGIQLPAQMDERTRPMAEAAAERNGYDDFSEQHSKLASLFHAAIPDNQYTHFCRLDVNHSAVSANFYINKIDARQMVQRVINKAYDQANALFDPTNNQSLSRKAAEWYAKQILNQGEGMVSRLHPCRERSEFFAGRLSKLERLVSGCEKALRERFDQELRESSSYYEMYRRDYFLEQVEIEDHDYNVNPFGSELLNGLTRLFFNDTQYTVKNLSETISELEEDARSHANTFFSCAYQMYRSYCREIETVAEEIGKELSDDELQKLGLLRENRTV